jgi:hypothetical protein
MPGLMQPRIISICESALQRMLLLCGCAIMALPAAAHTVFLFVSLEDSGEVRIESGFSDGGTGAGLPVRITEDGTGKTLSEHRMPESGVLVLPAPDVPFLVTLDAGEGHKVTKPGPKAPRSATPQALIVDVHWGAPDAQARQAIANAAVVIVHDWLYERMKDAFADQTVVLVQGNVALASESTAGAKLRSQVRSRIEQAAEAAENSVILSPVDARHFPDWAWLLDEGLAAVATAEHAAPAEKTPAAPAASSRRVPEL